MENLKQLLGETFFKEHVEPKLDPEKKYFFGEGDFIPKGRFDEVNNQVRELKSQVSERDEQLKDLGTKAKGNEELEKQIQELQTANQTKVEEYETKLKQQEYDFAYKTALGGAGAKDEKVLDALIDREKIVFKDGGFSGLNEQIENLKKTHDYVFNQATEPKPAKLGVPIDKGQQESQNQTDPTNQKPWNRHKRFT